MTTNDSKIIALKEQIAVKREEIKTTKTKSIAPITNCSLTLWGNRYNLHTLTHYDLAFLLVSLAGWKKQAEELNVLDMCVFSGYHINDWITDITNKLNYKKVAIELEKLALLETRLVNLLSEDKKTAMELDDITKLLG